VTIIVGSGADDACAPIIPPVTRNTIANDALNAAAALADRVRAEKALKYTEDEVEKGIDEARAGRKAARC
jgi:nuclear transport factor 2 (NTF2) superfamily protein